MAYSKAGRKCVITSGPGHLGFDKGKKSVRHIQAHLRDFTGTDSFLTSIKDILNTFSLSVRIAAATAADRLKQQSILFDCNYFVLLQFLLHSYKLQICFELCKEENNTPTYHGRHQRLADDPLFNRFIKRDK